MNPLTNTRNITKLNERELSLGISERASWHNEYKDSAWIFVGGLSYDLTEGDLLCVFSQYGEIVNINLVRDKKTGKTLGYCFICYEDQRSTVLAVDNFNGIKLCSRTIRVDHVNNYRMPKQDADIDPMTQAIREKGCAPAIMPDIVKLASDLTEDDGNRPIKQEVIDLESDLISATTIKREKPDRSDFDTWRNRTQPSLLSDNDRKDQRHDDNREERSRDKIDQRQRTSVLEDDRDRESRKRRAGDKNGDEFRERSRKNGDEAENADGRRDRKSRRSASPGSSGESSHKAKRGNTEKDTKRRRSRERSVEKERRRRSRERSPAREKSRRSQETNVEIERRHKSSEGRSEKRTTHKRERTPAKESPQRRHKQSKKQKHKSRQKSSSSEGSSSGTDSSSSFEPPSTKSSSKKHSKRSH